MMKSLNKPFLFFNEGHNDKDLDLVSDKIKFEGMDIGDD